MLDCQHSGDRGREGPDSVSPTPGEDITSRARPQSLHGEGDQPGGGRDLRSTELPGKICHQVRMVDDVASFHLISDLIQSCINVGEPGARGSEKTLTSHFSSSLAEIKMPGFT